MYVLDTMVVSTISGSDPDKSVLAWLDSVDDSSIYFSVIVVAEIRKGIEKAKRLRQAKHEDFSSIQNDEMELESFIVEHWDRFLPIDSEVASEWGRLVGLKEQGLMDKAIAATANVRNFAVVTRNTRHFTGYVVNNAIDPYKFRIAGPGP